MKLILATVSVLALGVAGISVGNAQTSTTPRTAPSAAAPSGATTNTQINNVSKEQVEQAQQELKNAGMYKGQIDGEMGPETQQAIKEFQQQKGISPTGSLDQQTLQALNQGGGTATGSTPAPSTNAPTSPGHGPVAPGQSR